MKKKKKPLDLNEKPCQHCGVPITVLQARRWDGLCTTCYKKNLDKVREKTRCRIYRDVMKYHEMGLEQAAYVTAPMWFRLLGLSLPRWYVNWKLDKNSEWEPLKTELRGRDKIWPFCFGTLTLAMREGYVVIRNGKPYKVIVTRLS